MSQVCPRLLRKSHNGRRNDSALGNKSRAMCPLKERLTAKIQGKLWEYLHYIHHIALVFQLGI